MKNNDYTTVPKSNVARKKVIWKDITIGDIVFMLVCFGMAFAIPFPIPGVPLLIKIVACLGVIGLCILLLVKNKTTGLRYYKYFWLVLKFLVTKKKYHNQEINKTISNVQIENGHIKQVYHNQKMFLKAFKVYGIDLLTSSLDSQIRYVDYFHEILKSLKKFITLVKIKEMHDWDENLKAIYETIDKMKAHKEEFETPQQYKAKLNQLDALLDWFQQEKETHRFTSTGWYVFCFGNSVEEVDKDMKDVMMSFNDLFHTEEQSLEQTLVILKNLWQPLAFNKIDVLDGVDKVSQLPEGDVSFYTDMFKINKNYYSIGTLSVDKFPLNPDLFWLNRLAYADNSSMVINLNPIKNDSARQLIQKTINNSAYLENQINPYKNAVAKAEYQQQLAAVEGVKENIASGKEVLINTNIYFLTYGKSPTQTKSHLADLKKLIKNENMVYNPLNFRQKDFFATIIPNGFDSKIISESLIYPGLPLAGSFPIQSSTLIDRKGCLLGINSDNNPVVLDITVRTDKRVNSNGLVLGNTGSGKTTTVKKLINNHLANDGIAFVLDPEQDYVHLAHYYGGKVIDASNGDKARINPLQVLLNENDEEANTNLNLISNHLSLLMQWFAILNLNLNNSQMETLKYLIIELYQKWGLYDKDLYQLNPDEFPTFTDLVSYIQQKYDGYKKVRFSAESDNNVFNKAKDAGNLATAEELLEIGTIIAKNFTSNGMYENLYNGHSTLKIGNDTIVVFDVKNLLANLNPNRRVAQLLLIVAYIQNAINLNGYSSNPKQALLVADEAHLFIDANYPDVLIFLSQMSKRIRKRSGGVWITTQNPSDFVVTEDITRYTKALMENTQYTIIQTLKPNDAKTIVEMYEPTPNPLTEFERKFIQDDKKGQALVIASNKQRQCVQISVLDEEFNAIGLNPLDKFYLAKIDMSVEFEDYDDISLDQLQNWTFESEPESLANWQGEDEIVLEPVVEEIIDY